MNQSDYLKSIMKMVGKVSPQNRGYLRASGLDKAYGISEAQRAGVLAQLGMRREGQRQDVSMGKKRLAEGARQFDLGYDEDARRFNLGYNQAADTMDYNEGSMRKANILSALGLGVGVMQGVNQARQIDRITEELKNQRKIYDQLIAGYGQ